MSNELAGLIALAHDSRFRDYAATNILNSLRLKSNLKRECCYWMLRSAMAREDWKCCRMYARDWQDEKSKPTAVISKFVPGSHYHVLDTKFNSFKEAETFLEEQGYRYGGFRQVKI